MRNIARSNPPRQPTSALLDLPRDGSPEFAAGWRAAVLRAGEVAFGVGSPEAEALERLARSSGVTDDRRS